MKTMGLRGHGVHEDHGSHEAMGATMEIDSQEKEEKDMKTCPVCQARTFDDADVCYGCLYRFEDEEALPQQQEAPETQDMLVDAPPAFSIRFTPQPIESGGMVWNCAVEVA